MFCLGAEPIPGTPQRPPDIELLVNRLASDPGTIFASEVFMSIWKPIDRFRSFIFATKIRDIRYMPHGRSPMRAVPRLIHSSHMLNNLSKSNRRLIIISQPKSAAYRCHLTLRQRHTYHDTLPTCPHRKHRSRLGASNHLARRSVLHQVQQFL